ncbi:hypothetical protein J6590_020780 [Homalodisca vitripennis]|nr:hypothetical protein J6590_020780 [Homalodisca vitripennis]
MFFFRRHQRGAAPKVLSKPALMAGGTRILGGGIGKTRKYNKAMHQLNGRRDSAITLSTRRSTLTLSEDGKGFAIRQFLFYIDEILFYANLVISRNEIESCRESFRELELLTLPCLYVLEVIMYCKSKCDLVRGGSVHHYETRGRDNFRTRQYRLTLSQHLPQQVGVRLINKLPESVKLSANQHQFKTRLKRLLVSKAFYSVDEFMVSRWDV